MELQRDSLRGRKFTLADAIGREAGSFLKGESPIPRLVQATIAIDTFIGRNLADTSGVVQVVLCRWVDENTARVSRHLDVPLQALLELLESIVENPPILHEFVWQVDVQWGKVNAERPFFQRPGQKPHPEDEHTHESVRYQLVELRDRVREALMQG
nr:hypothetical protein [Rubidibacter lacunae]